MPRRFHNKSRFGCLVCKRRRVKCDERQPVCGGCAKTRSKCVYACTAFADAVAPLAAAPDEPEKSLSPAAEDRRSASGSQPVFDLLDLGLIHHYATDTSRCLFTGEQQSQVWQHHIPALAASNSVLMRGILALTALHHARKDPDRRDIYMTRALHHHGMGLPLFKDLVASASPEVAEVIVAYSILLGIWVYASPEVTTEQLSLDDILGTVEIVRTGRAVFHMYREVVTATPIGRFLIPPCREPLQGSEVSSAREALEALRCQVAAHPCDGRAVCHLQMLLDRYLAGADHTRTAAGWMASVGQDYWARLRAHQRHALLVFAYSCILAYASEHECWWLAGWSERILLACSEVLRPADKDAIGWDGHERAIRSHGVELANVARRRSHEVGYGG